MQTGLHSFLAIPPGFPKKRLLHLQAKLVPLNESNPCDDKIFIKRLEFEGSWLRPLKSLEFKTATNEFNTNQTIQIKVNKRRMGSVEEFVSMVPPEKVTAQRYHPRFSKWYHPRRHMDTLVVTLKLGPTTVKVGFAHTHNLTNWLWVKAVGLENVTQQIGGLMGGGGNLKVQKRDKLCAERKVATMELDPH